MRVFALTGGELFIIAFIIGAILSARYWPSLGERLVLLLGRHPPASKTKDGNDNP